MKLRRFGYEHFETEMGLTKKRTFSAFRLQTNPGKRGVFKSNFKPVLLFYMNRIWQFIREYIVS